MNACSRFIWAPTAALPRLSVLLLRSRRLYEANTKQVQAAAAALKHTLEAELAVVKAKAKAERQNADKTARERSQAEIKEIVQDRSVDNNRAGF